MAFPALAEAPLPAAPNTHLFQQTQVLTPQTARALEVLLLEHERATTEQVVIGIFGELGDEDLVDYTNRVFREWRIGQSSKNNGVLLALYWKDRKIRIEVGYGLEPLLTDAKSREIIEEHLKPYLKEGNPDRALAQGAYAILGTLESPIVASGKAKSILQGGFQAPSRYPQSRSVNPLLWVVLVGIFFLMSLLDRVNPDAHYSSTGWTARRRLRMPSRMGGFGGGGGIFGGGGGFSGGGGRSGGGGASGSW